MMTARKANGVPVEYGDTLVDFRGKEWTFVRASAVRIPGKSGKVTVCDGSEIESTFYDNVFDVTVSLAEEFHGPQAITDTFPGKDLDGNGIVVTFHSWRDLYLWDCFSWSDATQTYQQVINDNGEMTIAYESVTGERSTVPSYHNGPIGNGGFGE